MLFLLPPSESKAIGGGLLSISDVALTFGGLNHSREQVLGALIKLCKRPAEAAKVLKLSAKQLGAIEVNLQIPVAPTMRALERYTGTLFDAIDAGALQPEHWHRVRERVLIQTALFGLIPGTDLIPNYRLSANSALPKINLKQVWTEAHHASVWPRLNQGVLIDLRSKAYAELAPIPANQASHWVEVVSRESNGQLRALNHFNKLAKGLLVGAMLKAPAPPQNLEDLAAIADSIGMELTRNGNQLQLVTDQIIKSKRAG